MRNNVVHILLFVALLLMGVSCENGRTVQTLTLSSHTLTMQVGQDKQLELIIAPLSASAYNTPVWKSSDPRVAQVDSKGNIQAVYSGECIISVSCGDIKDECTLYVKAPEYNIIHDKAYIRQVIEETNVHTKVYSLKLLDNNLTLDTATNEIIGNGLFVNVELKSSIDNAVIDTGVYQQSSNNVPLTFTPGELVEYSSSYYATGTYLGQYSDNGLSAIFMQQGTVKVNREGNNYDIEAYFVGTDGELVSCSYSGELVYYNNNQTNPERLELKYDNVSVDFEGYTSDNKRSILKVTMECDDGKVFEQHIVVPISSGVIPPVGKYETSDDEQNFTIILRGDEGSQDPMLKDGANEVSMKNGEIEIIKDGEEFIYKLQYKDINGRIITINK